MSGKDLNFLADESCDFNDVRALRSKGYDVLSVAESFPAVSDKLVLKISVDEERTLLTEDKDSEEWIFAHRQKMTRVLLIRFPGNMRSKLSETVTFLVEEHAWL